MKLYHKAQSTGQGIIADEVTGRTVAVVYDSKDGDLLAAAPDMLTAGQAVLDAWEAGDLAAAVRELQNAVNKAKGL